MATFSRARARLVMAALVMLLGLLHIPLTAAQRVSQAPTLSPSPSTLLTPSSTRSAIPGRATTIYNATANTVALNDSIIARSRINLNATQGAFFNFTIPPSAFSEDTNSVKVWTSISLCSGPAIPPYNTSNATVLEQLDMSATDARRSTLASLYISDNDLFQQPGPANASVLNSKHIGFALGGSTSVEVDVQQQSDNSSQTLWIGVWPPADSRNVTPGTYQFQIVASTRAKMESVDYTRRPRLDDTDQSRALVSSFNFTTASPPNLNVIVLPTFGSNSLSDADYYNSSFCAIADAWANVLESNEQVLINSSNTKRGTEANKLDDSRRQFEISGLDAGTNYTVWLFETNTTNQDVAQSVSTTLFPAIKMLTKRNDNCRLVFDVPFCPNVAYSIPVNPSISTTTALSVIEGFVDPQYSNFSTTIDTFPCGSREFGMYSYVQTCDNCKKSYQDWLCAVAMPRCTDPLQDPDTQSRATQDGTELTGAPTGLNTGLLSYIVNRNGNGTSALKSRQPFIDQQLRPGFYGELLPCIYTCYFVERTCPPLIQWACPIWDITAQRDYGTFADSGEEGIGAAENGGAGSDGMRWGGYQRYIATDAFGNAYCNSMGVDFLLRESNGSARRSGGALWIFVAAMVSLLTTLAL
ncbi:related to Calcium influx promoting protein ehs1 [Sporisorium reilianum f. sp. reilianum]|uniref:Related to Calcium influx promoting protein ehs1 n=1 Tax=Sporisorium reilianum f. sp. reilianum TaxID=72559 RepID=A0A2N8UN98_9BASI|nr:related to Calcium influx promoting protein ehs1 [Sporisorium reilianum f. sp. reilianum]